MLLTQSTTFLIGWIATLMGYVMQFIFVALRAIGIQNIGLCIFAFTFIIRIVMLPLMVKQQKFTKMTQAMQPELNKIQKKYRNKKDQASMQKQQKETQELYDKYGISPTGGCGQILIQFPVLLALYQVIRKVPAYIPEVKNIYMTIVDSISGNAGYINKINDIGAALNSSYIKALPADATPDQIIDVLNYFKTETWTDLAGAFPNAAETIHKASSQIIHMNDFALGINIAQTPGFHPSVYWLIPVLAVLFQFLAMKTMQSNNGNNGSDPTAQMTNTMTWMMPLMSGYFCLIMPAGLGIYWIASALFQFIQQIVINAYYDRIGMETLIAKNKEAADKKREARRAKGKKTLGEKMNEYISGNTEEAEREAAAPRRPITHYANINAKKISYNGSDASVDYDALGEIGKKAHLVSRYHEEQAKSRGGN